MKVKASTEKKKQGFGMTIPESVMVETGIAEAKCAELHRLKHCVAVLQGKMTAYELIETIRDINKLSEFLTVQLSKACGTCDDCGSCVQPQESKIKVPPELLDELNLPHNAKLEAYRCDVKRVTTINFDRNVIRKYLADMNKRADEASAELDRCLVNGTVEYEAPFDVNDSFADVLTAYIESRK